MEALVSMCYFITVGVPASGADALASAVPRAMALGRTHNQSVTEQMGTEYDAFVLTSGMCSCSLYSERNTPLVRKEKKLDVMRRKYKRLGWSEAKIARALKQSEEHGPGPTGFVGLRDDVRALLASVAEQVEKLAVVAHWYEEDLERGKITLTKGPHVTPTELRTTELPTQVDQILYVSTELHRHSPAPIFTGHRLPG
jgi:hypothetical protein